MKRGICLFFIVFFAFGVVFPQQNTFRKDYAFSSMDIPGNMIQTSTGEFVFCGFNTTWLPIYGNITKTDMHGNLVWSKGVLGSIATAFTDVIEVAAAQGGGYLLAGESSPGAILVRLDVNGNLIWARRYQYPSSGGEYFNKVIQTTDGHFLGCGGVSHFWDGSAFRDSLMPMAMKIDQSNGNILWDRVYVISVPNADEHSFLDVAETADGYVFVGYSSEGTGTINSDGDYPRDGIIVKTNTSGTLTYARKFGSAGQGEGVEAITRLSTGDVLMSGWRGDRAFLMRINGTGATPTISFGHRYERDYLFTPEPLVFSDVMEMPDGHYAAIGTYVRPLMFPFEIYSTVTKVNSSNGNLIYGKTYVPTGTMPVSFSILPKGNVASDGSYFMFMTAMQMAGYNYHVLKTDATGSLNNPVCPEGTYSPTRANYVPALTSFSPTIHSNLAGSTVFTPTINNLTPTVTTVCQYSPCIPPPNPTLTAVPNPICAGQSVTLTASGSGANVTYRFYTVAVGGTAFATGTTTVVTPAVTTTYYVDAEDNTQPGCFSNRTSVTVTVHPLPNPNITSNSPLCIGGTLNLGASNGTNGYQWSGPNSWSSTSQNPVISPVNTVNSGTYSVTVTDGNGCTNSASVSVTVNSNPVVNLGANQTICDGQSVLLDAGAGFTNYAWSPSGNTQTINVTTSGTYSVTVTDASSCSGSASVVITVLPQADATITTPVTTYCSNDASVNFTATNSGGVWSGNGISSSGLFNPSIAGAGVHTITYSISGQCGDSDDIIITVHQAPSVNLGPDSSLCIGDVLTLDAGAGYVAYSWSPSGSNQALTVSTTGTYSVTVTDANGCQGTDQIQVSFVNQQDATILTSGAYCLNAAAIQFTAVDPGGVWSGNGINNTGLYTPADAGIGIHQIIYNIPGGCGDADTTFVTVHALPQVSETPSDASCIGAADGSIILLVSNGLPPYQYLWNNSSILQNLENIIAGTYIYTVTDANGCSVSGQATVNDGLEDCFLSHIYIPNVFSPNGDGQNDLLFVRGEGIQFLEFVIYNRWGQKIFETNSQSKGWDGTFKDKHCDPGVFTYYVKASFFNGNEVNLYGNITLIR